MTAFEFVAIETQGPVALVTIQRPAKLNALNARVIAELTQAFQGLIEQAARAEQKEGEEPIRAVILTGSGKAFISGADIGDMAALTSVEAKRMADRGHALCALIESAPFPVIAAVNGFALGGGCEVALACDFIYAAEGAKLGQPEVILGILPGYGGTQRLLRRVGAGRARELIYTGDMITAEQALAVGLVNAVFPAEELLPRARDAALKIASRGPLAVAAAKRVMLRGESLDLPAACELEVQAFAALFGSEDQRAGMKAFLEKAKATFKGK
jgi:enoyl-CoA hydratase